MIRYAQQEASSLVIAASRLTIATLFLAPLVWFKNRQELTRLGRNQVLLALLSGFFLALHFANLDYKTHMALVALIREGDEEQIIGVARYALIQDRSESAEAAIVVRDDYQSKGLGSLLMGRLVQYARDQGVKSFIATVHTSNARIRYFIQRSGLANKRVMVEPGVWEIRIYLEEEGENN